jgi:hypothetical protein
MSDARFYNYAMPSQRRALLRSAVRSTATSMRIAKTLGYEFLVMEYAERIRAMRERHSTHFRRG